MRSVKAWSTFGLALMLASLAFPANADEKETGGKAKASVTTRVHTIVIGPDGKTEVSGDSLDDLPKGIRVRIEAAVKDAQSKALETKKNADQIRIDIAPKDVEGEAGDNIRVPLKAKRLDGGKMSISRQGSITIIGTDGKRQTRAFDPSDGMDAETIAIIIGGALGDDVKLPNEVTEQLEEALKSARRGRRSTDVASDAAILDRLDSILDRLEKVEADIRDLKRSE